MAQDEIGRKVELAWLAAFYGRLLTDKQRQVLSLHCEEDLSLGEIAQETGVSRQGVHDMLTRASRNEYLVRIILALRSIQNYFRVKFIADGPDQMIKSCEEHLQILDAVEKGDGELAEKLVRKHLLVILRYIPERTHEAGDA